MYFYILYFVFCFLFFILFLLYYTLITTTNTQPTIESGKQLLDTQPKGNPLVGVGEAAHAGHDAEHVVVHGIHAHLGRVHRANCVVGEGEDEGGVVNAREVAGARGLVFLRLERERVHVHANRRHVGVVLVRLH